MLEHFAGLSEGQLLTAMKIGEYDPKANPNSATGVKDR